MGEDGKHHKDHACHGKDPFDFFAEIIFAFYHQRVKKADDKKCAEADDNALIIQYGNKFKHNI